MTTATTSNDWPAVIDGSVDVSERTTGASTPPSPEPLLEELELPPLEELELPPLEEPELLPVTEPLEELPDEPTPTPELEPLDEPEGLPLEDPPLLEEDPSEPASLCNPGALEALHATEQPMSTNAKRPDR